MFKTRLISGVVLVALALVLIITGGDVLFAALLLISFIGMSELYRIFEIEKSLAGSVGIYLPHCFMRICGIRFFLTL